MLRKNNRADQQQQRLFFNDRIGEERDPTLASVTCYLPTYLTTRCGITQQDTDRQPQLMHTTTHVGTIDLHLSVPTVQILKSGYLVRTFLIQCLPTNLATATRPVELELGV